MITRKEADSIGTMEVPMKAYYGVQTLRAKKNFHITGRPLHPEFIKNLVRIKKAAAYTNMTAHILDEKIGNAIVKACDEIIEGKLHSQFIVDAIQGGAGTSANMNANEVIANRAIEILGGEKGDYTIVHPNDHVNMAQSTNDVIPSAGKLTILALLPGLLEQLERLHKALRDKSIEFDDVEAQDVLTPRVDVIAVADDTPMDEVTETFADSGYSRLPVYHETIDNIIGVVHEKDCFAAMRKGDEDVKLESLIGPTLYTTSVTPISALLRTLRESKHHMAVVVDEYGGTAGIITLEDIPEELVGEIWDEHDEVVEDIRQQSDGSWLIAGGASVDDVAEELDIRDKEEIDAVAIGGLGQEKLSRLPKVGDHFVWGSFDGTVTRATNRRVQEVRLVSRPPEPETKKPDRRDRDKD